MKSSVMEKKELETRNLEQQELQQVAGGNIIDEAVCYLKGHNWEYVDTHCDVHHRYDVYKYQCTRCGKTRYECFDRATGQTRPSSEREYWAVAKR